MPAARQRGAPPLVSGRDGGRWHLTLGVCAGRINREHGGKLTAAPHVGAEAREDRGEMFVQNAKLDAAIAAGPKELGYGG